MTPRCEVWVHLTLVIGHSGGIIFLTHLNSNAWPPQIVYNILPQLVASLIDDLLPPYNWAICCFSEWDINRAVYHMNIWDWKFTFYWASLASQWIRQHLLLKDSCGKSASIQPSMGHASLFLGVEICEMRYCEDNYTFFSCQFHHVWTTVHNNNGSRQSVGGCHRKCLRNQKSNNLRLIHPLL